MRKFRRIAALALSAVLLLGCMGLTALAAGPETLTIGIYSTTDMHGKCYSLNPISGKEVKDSFLKVAAAMKEERAALGGGNTILIDNGDIIQGTPIISYNMNIEGGKDNPMAHCLRFCGYDAFVLGNHEFNFNQDTQQIFYDMLSSTGLDDMPLEVICANYIDVKSQQPKMNPYIIRTFQVGDREFKVGILGFENVNVPNWDLPSHYDGADFVHKDNTERSYAYEWVNYWQTQLRDTEKCDFVIVSAHSGEGGDAVGAGDQGAVGEVSAEFNRENQVAHMIENTTGIDMVIAGHNHVPGVSSFKNADGVDVPVVNGGGSTLTKTLVTISSDGSFVIGESENLALADYENDVNLEKIMKPYYDRTLPFVSEEIGVLAGDWDDVTDLFHVESDTMNLVHEAQLWASGADLSLASPVANKDFCIAQLLGGKDTAPISLKDCYSFYKYDNNLLYMIEMNGKQLKDWLEKCVKDYTVEADGSVTGGGFGTDQLYGLDYDVYLGNPEGGRVVNMTYQGEPVTDDQTFKVALNSYRLSANAAGDEYGWYGVTGITMGGDKVLWDGSVSEQFGSIGGSVTLVIAEYIKAMTAEGRQITPPEARSHWTLNAGAAEAGTPAKPMTRLEFVEALYAAAGSPAVEGATPLFRDLKGSTAADWAAINGVIDGNGKGYVLPDEPVTREQAAVMLLNYAKSIGKGPVGAWAVRLSYADAADVHGWAVEGAMWNLISHVIPVKGNTFDPAGTVTAAELQVMLERLDAK